MYIWHTIGIVVRSLVSLVELASIGQLHSTDLFYAMIIINVSAIGSQRLPYYLTRGVL